jgi:FtsZ-binding cell division protein ZapB
LPVVEGLRHGPPQPSPVVDELREDLDELREDVEESSDHLKESRDHLEQSETTWRSHLTT